MSWLCIFSFSCLANPAASHAMPPTAVDAIQVAAHVRQAPPASAPLRCELQRVQRDGEQVLVAVVHATATVDGEYKFSVDGHDADGNTVSSSTKDAFLVQAGRPETLDGPSIDLGQGMALVGRLELRENSKLNGPGRLLARCSL